MIRIARTLLKSLPTLLTAAVLAVIAWLIAVNTTDPNEVRTYAQPVAVEVRGQDPTLILSQGAAEQVNVTLNAPQSVWQQLNTRTGLVRAFLDLSTLDAGRYDLPVEVYVDARPVQVVHISPEQVTIRLEPLKSQEFPLQLVYRGQPAVGYQAETAHLDPVISRVSGPASKVEQVANLRVTLDLTQARENITAVTEIFAVDSHGDPVEGVSVLPRTAQVNQPITQMGGYRNVVVKIVSQGKIAPGYRLTSISVVPPNITVYAEDPKLVEDLPGYVETKPIMLDNLKDDSNIPAELALPPGVSLVGNQVVVVQTAIEPVQSSLTIPRISVLVTGLEKNLTAALSPAVVDVLLSGPQPVLDVLRSQEIQVTIDLSGKLAGTYQVNPVVLINSPEIRVESVIPATIEVILTRQP